MEPLLFILDLSCPPATCERHFGLHSGHYCELKKTNLCYQLGLQVETFSQHPLPYIVVLIQCLWDLFFIIPELGKDCPVENVKQ